VSPEVLEERVALAAALRAVADDPMAADDELFAVLHPLVSTPADWAAAARVVRAVADAIERGAV
jgi:hypothetical protein